MACDIHNLALSILLLFSFSVQAGDRSSHMIRIRFVKPVSFDVEDMNDSKPTQASLSIDPSSNHVSKLIWNHPIPDQKISVALESFPLDNFFLDAILTESKNSSKQIQIGKAATDLLLQGKDEAGVVELQYRSDYFKEQHASCKIAYTVTDAI